MNWLAKINLMVMYQRIGAFKSALVLLCLIVISAFCGYRLGNFYHAFQNEKITQQQKRLSGLYQQQEEHVSRINMLEVELDVEKLANEKSQQLLKKRESEHFEVKKQLAFYEKVMAPEKQVDGIVLDQFIISSSESPGHYRFQVTLVQQQKNKRYASGYIDFVITGSKENKPAKVKLSEIKIADQTHVKFSFQYFQIIYGEFKLDSKFTPEQVLLSVVLPTGKWQKYHKLDEGFTWSQVLEN